MKIKIGFFDNPIIAFAFIFPFVKVNAYLSQNIQMITVPLVFMISIILYVVFYNSFSRISLWTILFSLVIILSTLLYNKDGLLYAFYFSMRMMAFFMVFDMYLSQKKYIIISVFENYLSILFAINLFFQIWRQDYWGYTPAMNYNNFFTGDNSLPFYVLSFIALMVVKYEVNGIKTLDIIKIAVAYLNLIKAWCASGIVATTICLILLFVFAKGILKFSVSLNVVTLLVSIIHFVLIFGNSLIVMLDNYLVEIFHKTIENSRLKIWRAAVRNIFKSPILGHGTSESGRLAINNVGGNYWYAHNFILDYLIQGGIALLIVFVILIAMDVRHTNRCSSKFRTLLCCVFIGQHIAFLTEGTIVDPIEYIIYILMFFSDHIENKDYIQEGKYCEFFDRRIHT